MPLALALPMPSHTPSNGARLVTTDGRELPLTATRLRSDAFGGIARTVLEQHFRNPHAEPLAVTYSLPLPSDGAVSGFAFVVGGRRIAGEVHRRADARAQFERALIEGRSAALLEQDRSSLFTQEIGNLPPGATVVAEVTVDQPLRWLDEGAWEWRFPTVVAPRYLGDAGRVPDAERVAQDVASGPLAARFTLSCTVRDRLAEGRTPESPSHAMTVTREGQVRSAYRGDLAAPAGDSHSRGATETATLADSAPRPVTLHVDDGARLDRDIVVRWAVSSPRVGLSLTTGRPAAHRPHADVAYGLLTIVPPQPGAHVAKVPRDLIVLLDTSGSMGGEPLAQARRVVSALVDTLGPADRLEMIEFSSRAVRWRAKPVAATDDARRAALDWLAKLRAGGSTEMRTGILEALRTLRAGVQRQVIVVTDGQIGFETEVIAAICERLPGSARLHTVGVGSAVNRSLTGPAARAGRGAEIILGLGEDPERAAARLVARTSAPIVVDIGIAGSALVQHAPHRLPDLFAGAPARLALSLRPEGGTLVVRGHTASGTWEQWLTVDPIAAGTGNDAVAAVFGREKIEDAELGIAAGQPRARLEPEIEKRGLDFQLATRLTSWLAVTQEITVDRDAGLRRERMPHELPHGMSAEGLGLRSAPADEGRLFSLSALDGMDALDAPTALAAPLAMPSSETRLGASSGPARGPVPGVQQIIRVEVGETEHLERSALRKTGFPGLWPMLAALLGSGLGYYFTRSIGLAIMIGSGAMIAVVLLQLLFRKLFSRGHR